VSKDKLKKMRRANAPPPPMLCAAQWEAAAEIGGAWNVKELGRQFELAVAGEFVVMELDWRRKGASNSEIRKRLANAAKVQKMAVEQEEKAKQSVMPWPLSSLPFYRSLSSLPAHSRCKVTRACISTGERAHARLTHTRRLMHRILRNKQPL
jgi:hypothetical protein